MNWMELGQTLINDPKGHTIKVLLRNNPANSKIIYDEDGNIKKVEGYLGNLWSILEEKLQFKTVWIEVLEGLGENINGTWNGLIGELQKGNADVGLSNMGITKERHQVVDFSASVDFDSSKFLSYSNKQEQNINWMTFFTALSWEIWVCVALLWVSLSFGLAFVTQNDVSWSKYNCLFMLFGAITLQGCESVPIGFKGRLIFIMYWAMCLVLYASFTARLTTQLTTPNLRIVSSVQQAIDDGYKIAVIRGSIQHQAFTQETELREDFKAVGQMLKSDESLLLNSPVEGIERVIGNERLLFMYDSNFLRFGIGKNCSYVLEPPSYFSGYLHFPFKKNFTYIEAFDQIILRLTSSGVLRKLSFGRQHFSTCEAATNVIPSLGLNKMIFAFAVMIGGLIAAILILGIELFLKQFQTKKVSSNEVKVLSKFSVDDFDFLEKKVRSIRYP